MPESEKDPVVEILAEEFYLVVAQATQDHWLLWEHLPPADRAGYYDLAYEVADKVRTAAPCKPTCAPHLRQFCSLECEAEAGLPVPCDPEGIPVEAVDRG